MNCTVKGRGDEGDEGGGGGGGEGGQSSKNSHAKNRVSNNKEKQPKTKDKTKQNRKEEAEQEKQIERPLIPVHENVFVYVRIELRPLGDAARHTFLKGKLARFSARGIH